MPYFVYILYSSKTDKYYVGATDDVKKRLLQHNSGRNLSTKSGAPRELKHTESFATNAETRKREAEIKKKKSRKYIAWLINSAG